MPTEQRAFAAVRKNGKQTEILPGTIRFSARDAREMADSYWCDGWPEAKLDGWSIRPVLIRVEDEGEGR